MMEPDFPTKYIIEWFARYIKNRDLIIKNIVDIRKLGNKLEIENKDGTIHVYLAHPWPTDLSKTIKDMKEGEIGIIVYNIKDNFDGLVKGWDELISHDVIIYFINPFSQLEKKWIIRPKIHSKISDPSTLKQGLMSMYMMVTPTTRKEIESLTN
ncbi:hypothetical protein HQ545_00195 [Candidatus Woesearchaeota archaeon]|nr:hypothetical protein [Candidatus Woesearchaeota archaeon]